MKKITSLILSIFLSVNLFFCLSAVSINNKSKNLNTVACIFAGREKYLSILMPYLLKLKSEGKLTEINLWQFTKNKSDIKYLESISNIHKTSKNFTEYRTITPKIENNEFKLKIKTKNDAHILINNNYEIVIGGWSNTKSVIRKGIDGTDVLCESNSVVLDANNYKDFNIKIQNNKLIIENLMEAAIDENKIKSVKIHTGFGSEGYWDYEETKNKNIKLFDTEKREGFLNWYEAYKYYLNYNFDIFLKIDDDIVYMDLNRYDEFINYIVNNKNKNCVFPNMVNHAVSLFYNNKYELMPDDIVGELYAKKDSPNDVYNYYTDGNTAKKVHEYFLNNISKFINNTMPIINLNNHKESICIFGILKKNYDKIFAPSLRDKIIKDSNGKEFKTTPEKFDDEIYVYNCQGNMFYPRFVTVHYQFGPQMRNGLDESFLNQYRKLAKNIK